MRWLSSHRARAATTQHPRSSSERQCQWAHHPCTSCRRKASRLGYDTYTVPFGLGIPSQRHLCARIRYPFGADFRRPQTGPVWPATSCSTTRIASLPSCWRWARWTTSNTPQPPAPSTSASRSLPIRSFLEILPTGVTTYEHVISMPWNEIDPATDDMEKAARDSSRSASRCAVSR
jgi:hypothetical protein